MSRWPQPVGKAPGEWVEEGLCATLGWRNWESLPADDQRAVCEACPVLEDCARWAAGHRWVGATVAGVTYPLPKERTRRVVV